MLQATENKRKEKRRQKVCVCVCLSCVSGFLISLSPVFCMELVISCLRVSVLLVLAL